MKHSSTIALAVFILSLLAPPALAQVAPGDGPIDRHALVSRHNVVTHEIDPNGAMAIGNGNFAYNFDVTGMQSFPEYYEKTMPIGILSTWVWHSFPNPHGYTLDNYPMTTVKKHDRVFVYPGTPMFGAGGEPPSPHAAYLRSNPHRFGLARIGLEMTKADGTKMSITDLKNIEQTLDLWTGIVTSSFEIEGVAVHVQSAVYGDRDEVSFIVESPLIAAGRLKVRLAFPYALGSFGHDYQDWTKPDSHQTVMTPHGDNGADFARTLDDTHYSVRTKWSAGARLAETDKHQYLLSSSVGGIQLSAWFSPKTIDPEADDAATVLTASQNYWQKYWTSGGVVDLAGNDDPRAAELERRIVLSQFLMAVHDGGFLPPQETGLAVNSWFGKFHMEMYWWHSAHWALWGHSDILEKSLSRLPQLMPAGEAMAEREGCKGVKWSKMTDPSGLESPSPIGPALIWEQPHPVYMAELVWRAHKGKDDERAVLERYKNVVFETADYMATFVDYDPERNQYVLGPGIASPAEKAFPNYAINLNPNMELGYWKWALETAQEWRARLGLAPDELWAKVIKGLAPLTVRDGVYPAFEVPEVTNAFGMNSWLYGILPGRGIDKEVMRKTVGVAGKLQPRATWDNPMMAMCSARLGDRESAIRWLAGGFESGKNPFRPSGYTIRGIGNAIIETPMYMPANGGWLTAVAMMAAGWDGCTERAPGFPKTWKVRFEGLLPLP